MAIVLGAALLAPRGAVACPAAFPPYVTLIEPLPAVRVGLPRDAAVLVRGQFWGRDGGDVRFAQVRLVDELGSPIPSRSDGWWHGAEPTVTVGPVVPLPPRTRFFVEATVTDEGPVRPAGADGPRTLRVQFETGDELAPPLVLAGPMQVTLEPFEVPPVTCSEPQVGCTTTACTREPARQALRARVLLPAATGGADYVGYRGELVFTGHVPATAGGAGNGNPGGPERRTLWSLPQSISVRPGVKTVILQEIVDAGEPYVPCFTFDLRDPAGHTVQAAPVCLSAVDHAELLPGPDAAGCSTLPANTRRPGLPAIIALAASAAFVVRRRRGDTARS